MNIIISSMAQTIKSLMPCNTFGPNDNYNLSSSHFLPALIRKIHEAHNKNQKLY